MADVCEETLDIGRALTDQITKKKQSIILLQPASLRATHWKNVIHQHVSTAKVR